ncbi:MAG: hypothetical protein AB1705_24420 [Verrucomicrobiota bacterium]
MATFATGTSGQSAPLEVGSIYFTPPGATNDLVLVVRSPTEMDWRKSKATGTCAFSISGDRLQLDLPQHAHYTMARDGLQTGKGDTLALASRARVQATTLPCRTVLNQFGVATAMYHADFGRTPTNLKQLGPYVGHDIDLLRCFLDAPDTRTASRMPDGRKQQWEQFPAGRIRYELIQPAAGSDLTEFALRCPLHGTLVHPLRKKAKP